ncbi:MAG: hypothetical protein CVT48_04645 [Thermoplasmata archaeon HGW-Thermoplasmata-1]|nr:MAG: hypothetical protein CVT48_04645 [Thermoplasmata archaeon HGW-Thermoplasmata-1]
MVYAIFRIEPSNAAKINDVLKDELANRQSVLTRDAGSLGMDGNALYFKVEGSEQGVERAAEILKENGGGVKMPESEAAAINRKIIEEEENAADGMGMIFG